MFKLQNLCLAALLCATAVKTTSCMYHGNQPGNHDEEKAIASFVAALIAGGGSYMGAQVNQKTFGVVAGLGAAALVCSTLYPHRSSYNQFAAGAFGAGFGVIISEYQKQQAITLQSQSSNTKDTKPAVMYQRAY